MRVLIAGGGTGGHLFPGIAIAEELRDRGDNEVLFVGTARGIEARLVPKEGYALSLIDVGGLKGGGVLGIVKGLLRIPKALLQSRKILKRFRPDLAVGVGGYASGPMLLVCALCSVPTAILEQNSVPGITNRILGRLVGAVFASFEASAAFFPKEKLRLAGNPIRKRLRAALTDGDVASHNTNAALHSSHGAVHKKTLLVLGGSQGAHAVNQLVVEAMELLFAEGRAPRVVHQTGKGDLASVDERYRAAGIDGEAREFIDDMAAAYREADLLVARAGATTLAEVTAIGRAAILVPFPFAADDHQTMNARALESAGAALLLPQATTTPRALAEAIAGLLSDDGSRAKMAEAARTLGRPDAARAIVDALVLLARP